MSMTGYGLCTQHHDWGSLHLELRSVNSRFLELQFKLPDEWRVTESLMRERIQETLKRGKVEIRLTVQPLAAGADQGAAAGVNVAAVELLRQQQQVILALIPDAQPLGVAQYLNWPGVLQHSTTAPSDMSLQCQQALAALDEALRALTASRQREGQQLSNSLLSVIAQIEDAVRSISADMPALIAEQQARLTERLTRAFDSVLEKQSSNPDNGPAKLNVSFDEVMLRVRQEVSALGLRADVSEETARLQSHLIEFKRTLSAPGPHGKRLDFLIQEMNREANTLGSKSLSLITTRASVDLKQFIEQLREQVQNLE